MSVMHRSVRRVLAGISALALAMPVAAQAEDAKTPAQAPTKAVKPALKARIAIAPARVAPAKVATPESAPAKAEIAEATTVIEVSDPVPKAVQEAPSTHKQTA